MPRNEDEFTHYHTVEMLEVYFYKKRRLAAAFIIGLIEVLNNSVQASAFCRHGIH